MSKPNIILLGAPGSGKGTQASVLTSKYGYSHISTGDLLRKEIAEKSELGVRVQEIMDRGDLVDDGTVLELLKKNCNLSSNIYIFDGFPRNLEQSKLLDEHVLGEANVCALYFHIDLDELVQRLVNRRTCKDCGAIYNLLTKPPQTEGVCDSCKGTNLQQRKDDNEESVRNRLEVFKSTIGPMLEYYETKGVLKQIDASQDRDIVTKEIASILG